jgi:hypothetical protein
MAQLPRYFRNNQNTSAQVPLKVITDANRFTIILMKMYFLGGSHIYLEGKKN